MLLVLSACGVTSIVGISASVASASTTKSVPATGCLKWGISGTWAVIQSNESRISTFVFAEKGKVLTGNAVSGAAKGTISGTMKPDSATFTITWSTKTIGHYYGVISTRTMVGHTYAKGHHATWSATGPTTCRG